MFDDMIADMESNTKSPMVTELFLGGRRHNFQSFLYHNLISKCLTL